MDARVKPAHDGREAVIDDKGNDFFKELNLG
jgi:hypothetical protein